MLSLAGSPGAKNGADRTTRPPKHERGPLAVNRRRDAAISRRRDPMLERGEGEDPIVSGAIRAGDFAIANGRRRFEGRAAMVTRRIYVSGAHPATVVPEVTACHCFPLPGSRRSVPGFRHISDTC